MTITINHKTISATEGEKLIEILRREGFDVPSLCYANGKKHQASCMVCVVKNTATGQIIPSCSTVVTDGMQIDSESDDVKHLRRQALELLLSDHLAVCRAPCKPDDCTLRKYANIYRAKWNKYPRYSAVKPMPPLQVNGNLWFDATKCIRCGLCVYNSNGGFAFKYRGFQMQVVCIAEQAKHIDENLYLICPTQALYRIQ